MPKINQSKGTYIMISNQLIDATPVIFRGRDAEKILEKVRQRGRNVTFVYHDLAKKEDCCFELIDHPDGLCVYDYHRKQYFSSGSRHRGTIRPGTANTYDRYVDVDTLKTFREFIQD